MKCTSGFFEGRFGGRLAGGVLAAGLVICLTPTAARAQWRIGAEYGLARFHGATSRTDGDSVALEPYGPAHYRVTGSYQGGRWQVSLAIFGSTPGLGGNHAGLIFVSRDASDLLAIEATVGRRLVATGNGGQLFVEVGPAYNIWSTGLDDDLKSGLGATAAMMLSQRLTGRLGTRIRVHAAVAPSFIDKASLPPELRRANVWRLGLSAGLDFRL